MGVLAVLLIVGLVFYFVVSPPSFFLWVGSPGGAPSWVGVGVALCGPSPAWVGPPWAPWPPPPPAGGAPAWGLRLWGGFFPSPLFGVACPGIMQSAMVTYLWLWWLKVLNQSESKLSEQETFIQSITAIALPP